MTYTEPKRHEPGKKNSFTEDIKVLDLKVFNSLKLPMDVEITTHSGGYIVSASRDDIGYQWMLDQTGRSWKMNK